MADVKAGEAGGAGGRAGVCDRPGNGDLVTGEGGVSAKINVRWGEVRAARRADGFILSGGISREAEEEKSEENLREARGCKTNARIFCDHFLPIHGAWAFG